MTGIGFITVGQPSATGPPNWIRMCGLADSHGMIGVATLLRDRLVGWHAGPREGTVVTKPFVLDGPSLVVNVDAKYGAFAVEVLDAEGAAIPGYTW